MSEPHHIKRLYISDSDKKIAGVCGGIAEFLNVDSAVLRVAVILVAVLTAVIPMVLFYILASIVMPHRPHQEKHHVEAH